MKITSIHIPKQRQFISDFYAACLLLTIYPGIVRIHRGVNVQEQDALIGDGSSYDPNQLIFGQPPTGQMAKRHEPLTPLGRVLQHINQYHNAGITWPWLYPLELRETLGTTEVARHLDCTTETIARLGSPMDAIIVKEFQSYDVLDETAQMFHNMIYTGEYLCQQLQNVDTLLAEVRQKHRVIDVDGIKVLWLDDLADTKFEPIISRYVMLEARDVSVSVKPDTKGNGWALFKFRSSPAALDFGRIASDPEIAFCQARGTLVKTKTRCDEGEIRRIIRLSRIVNS